MKKYILLILMIFICLLTACKKQEVKVHSGSVMMYSTMSNDELNFIKEMFENNYAGVTFDYYYSNKESVRSLLDEEKASGMFNADVLFGFDLDTLNELKGKGYLADYKSKESKKFPKDLKDKDGTYVGLMKKDGVVVPIALLKDSPCAENGKLLIDFLLSDKFKEYMKAKGFEVLKNE